MKDWGGRPVPGVLAWAPRGCAPAQGAAYLSIEMLEGGCWREDVGAAGVGIWGLPAWGSAQRVAGARLQAADRAGPGWTPEASCASGRRRVQTMEWWTGRA